MRLGGLFYSSVISIREDLVSCSKFHVPSP